MAYIYKITNDINNKVYIGKTTRTLEQRFHEHELASKNPKGKSKFHWAIKRYGIEHFKLEKIEECSADEVNEKEKYWIEFYNSFYEGYNNTFGGDGRSLSEQQIQDIYSNWDEGLSSKEISKKLNIPSSTVLHRLLDYENYSREEGLYRSLKEKFKPVDQYDLDGCKIQSFASLKEAGKSVGVSGRSIQNACNNHGTSKGYYWTYKDEDWIKKAPKLYGGHGDRSKNGKQKRVAKLDDNGEILEIFISAAEAAKSVGKNKGAVAAACRGDYKTCGGYKWKYLNE